MEEKFEIAVSLNDAMERYQNRFKSHSCIRLWSGKVINFLDPKPDDILLSDIALGLSNTCRFAGQCGVFYSVAEHSVLVSRLVEMRLGKAAAMSAVIASAFMHDAPEAYIGDMTTPLKMLCPGYKMVEAQLEIAIRKRFGLSVPFSHQMIKEVDFRVYQAEGEEFFRPIDLLDEEREFGLPEPLRIQNLRPRDAEREFLARAEELGIKAA